MRVLYFDAIAGVSGDMTVGALLMLGLPWDALRATLEALPLAGYALRTYGRKLHGIEARRFEVQLDAAHGGHGHRRWRDVREMLEQARLTPGVRERALLAFQKLAIAEGKVHGVPPEDVVFHEVGAVDSIVDIVAVSVGLEYLGVQHGYVSELPLGRGLVRSEHGVLPIPGPATLEVLRNYRVRFEESLGELVTPTGAAIVAAFARPYPAPPLRPLAVGYGAGSRELSDRPNVLRLVLAEEESPTVPEEMVVVETNLDDLSPQWFDWITQRLFASGARDVWLTPVQMKKARPGFVLSALIEVDSCQRLAECMLEESPTLGVRSYPVRRYILPREEGKVSTRYGEIRVKIARTPAGRTRVVPEYADCQQAAEASGDPLTVVYAEVAAAICQRWPQSHGRG